MNAFSLLGDFSPATAMIGGSVLFAAGLGWSVAAFPPHEDRLFQRAGHSAALTLSAGSVIVALHSSNWTQWLAPLVALVLLAGGWFLVGTKSGEPRLPSERIGAFPAWAILFLGVAAAARAVWSAREISQGPMGNAFAGGVPIEAMWVFCGAVALGGLYLTAAAAHEVARTSSAAPIGAVIYLAASGLFGGDPFPFRLISPAGLSQNLLVPALMVFLLRHFRGTGFGAAWMAAACTFGLTLIDPLYAAGWIVFALCFALASLALDRENASGTLSRAFPLLVLWAALVPALAAGLGRGVEPWLILGGRGAMSDWETPLLASIDPAGARVALRVFGHSPMAAGLHASPVPALCFLWMIGTGGARAKKIAPDWPALRAGLYVYLAVAALALSTIEFRPALELFSTALTAPPLLVFLASALALSALGTPGGQTRKRPGFRAVLLVAFVAFLLQA